MNDRLHELATLYHMECASFDRMVCTGIADDGSAVPATDRERALVSNNAWCVRWRTAAEALKDGFTREELYMAINEWHGSLPHSVKTLWIVAARTEEYGRVYLADYAGSSRQDTIGKVMLGAHREGFTGTLEERLESLGWEVVCLDVQEVTPQI